MQAWCAYTIVIVAFLCIIGVQLWNCFDYLFFEEENPFEGDLVIGKPEGGYPFGRQRSAKFYKINRNKPNPQMALARTFDKATKVRMSLSVDKALVNNRYDDFFSSNEPRELRESKVRVSEEVPVLEQQ